MSDQLSLLASSNMDTTIQLSLTHQADSESNSSLNTDDAASTSSAKRFPCRVCKKPFSSSSNRIRHERKQHSTASTTAKMACLFCDKACFGQRALQLHAQTCRGIPSVAAVVAEEASSQGSSVSASVPALRRRIIQAEDDTLSGGIVVGRSIAPDAEELQTFSDSGSDSDPSFLPSSISDSDSDSCHL
jgi:hypothetical protein